MPASVLSDCPYSHHARKEKEVEWLGKGWVWRPNMVRERRKGAWGQGCLLPPFSGLSWSSFPSWEILAYAEVPACSLGLHGKGKILALKVKGGRNQHDVLRRLLGLSVRGCVWSACLATGLPAWLPVSLRLPFYNSLAFLRSLCSRGSRSHSFGPWLASPLPLFSPYVPILESFQG